MCAKIPRAPPQREIAVLKYFTLYGIAVSGKRLVNYLPDRELPDLRAAGKRSDISTIAKVSQTCTGEPLVHDQEGRKDQRESRECQDCPGTVLPNQKRSNTDGHSYEGAARLR